MHRFISALIVVLLCVMGAILFYLPWTAIWERNWFLAHYPFLMRIFLHPSFRGAVSGLGILDIFLAVTMIAPASSASAPTRVRPQ